MRHKRLVESKRTIAALAAAGVLVLVAALSASGADGLDENAVSRPIAGSSLEQFGEFEVVDAKQVVSDLAGSADISSALSKAREQEFGRPGAPEGSLLRVVDTATGLIPLEKGALVWAFRWSAQGEEYRKAFPAEDGRPNETVFVLNDYFLLVNATSGEVIASIQH
jgi:hypothetical protein